jgi:hypothetical protein
MAIPVRSGKRFQDSLAPEWYAEIGRDMRYAKIVDLDVVGSNPITRPNYSRSRRSVEPDPGMTSTAGW